MWDRDGDGFPEVPTDWQGYTGGGCLSTIIFWAAFFAIIIFLLHACEVI